MRVNEELPLERVLRLGARSLGRRHRLQRESAGEGELAGALAAAGFDPPDAALALPMAVANTAVALAPTPKAELEVPIAVVNAPTASAFVPLA